MIISCPSCATRYDLPRQQIAADGSVIRCASCGHSWLEASAVEVIDISPEPALQISGSTKPGARLPMVVDAYDDTDDGVALELESRRIAAAAAQAERQFSERRRRRRARATGWLGLASAVAATLGALYLLPAHVVRFAPGAALAYKKIGMPVNVHGFEIRKVVQQHLLSDGTRVLALRGEVANVSGTERKVPALRFIIKDKAQSQVYAWTLNGVATKALQADQTTTFVTRLAEPPETADEVEIRFARAEEIGSNAQP